MSPQQIKRLRKTLQFTQQKLADAIGARQHTVARWETGRNQPRGANLKALRELAAKARKKSQTK
jgi:DNA-binding transcriptional regulator YiaG